MFRAFLTRFFLDQNLPLKNKLQFLPDSEICHRNFPRDFQQHSLNFYFCCQDDVLLKMSILAIKFWHFRNSTMIEASSIIQLYCHSKMLKVRICREGCNVGETVAKRSYWPKLAMKKKNRNHKKIIISAIIVLSLREVSIIRYIKSGRSQMRI